MSPTVELSRRLEQAFREPAAHATAARSCPSTEAIRAAVALESSAGGRRTILDHVATCPACSVAWDALRELRASAPVSRPSPLAIWGPLAAAAALAFAFWLVPQQEVVGPGHSEWRTSRQAYDWSPGTDETRLSSGSTTLRWAPGPSGTRFDLLVTDANLQPVSRAFSLEAPEYSLPADSIAALAPGSVLFWQVDAILPDGTRVTSPTFTATWMPPED